jgi:hypothetical protein
MTTYNELAGLRVNYLSSDPTLNSGNEGQVWYNSTTGTLRSLVQNKAWSALVVICQEQNMVWVMQELKQQL